MQLVFVAETRRCTPVRLKTWTLAGDFSDLTLALDRIETKEFTSSEGLVVPVAIFVSLNFPGVLETLFER
jgi:hypothetical protein